MSLHDLGKKSGSLDRVRAAGEPSPMPAPRHVLFFAPLLLAARLEAQGVAITSDLWRVAQGTVVAPSPFAAGATALLWTPVIDLPAGTTARFGVTSIHAAEEVGVTGGAIAASSRFAGAVFSVVWGRIGIDDIARTETSPEATLGTIPVDAEVFALGASRRFLPWLDAGAAARLATGRLGDLTRTQVGLDLGALATVSPHLVLGASTRAFDPTMPTDAATWQLAAQLSSAPFDALGGRGTARLRYGATLQRGEEMQHLATLGFSLGSGLEADAGAVREAAAGSVVWRSRIGISVGTPHYRLEFGRDGGVNGFGATYAFGLVAQLR